MTSFEKSLVEVILPHLQPIVERMVEERLSAIQPAEEVAELLPKNKVKEMMNISDATLWRWERSGVLVPVRVGVKVFYRKEDLDGISKKR